VGSQKLWLALCNGFDLEPDAYATNAERVARRNEVVELLEDVFSTWTAEKLLDRLDQLGIPAGRVRSMDEVYSWEQTASQGLVVDVDHETLGTVSLPGPPLRFFSVDGVEVTRRQHRPPPVLGADTAEVRGWLRGQD
jgi:crotonobetainyl-CoA:carnitine CoA-transferase CaiB-like acyl-CoA transferase